MPIKGRVQMPKGKEESFSSSSMYQELLESIKSRIQNSQQRAGILVNQELVLLYYHIGREILERQEREGWGTQVIDRLASDLKKIFPELKGFSPRNLKYMRSFAYAYPDHEFVQALSAQISWSHHLEILEKLSDPVERTFYIQQTIEHGWSVRILGYQIDIQLYQRQGKALNNFEKTLPAPHSENAKQIFKDPYILDFISLAHKPDELEIERSLINEVEKFLIELGSGFAFMGRQYHLSVDGQDYYLDLLFYHVKLRCFVVVELKTEAFKPEHAGKMGFYLTTVDKQLRHSTDQPSIGLILCRSKRKLIVEYALQPIQQPIGVSTYQLKILETLPKELQGQLPSIEEFEAELGNK